MTTLDQILSLCRAYVEHTDARRYSSAQLALTLLAAAVRALPPEPTLADNAGNSAQHAGAAAVSLPAAGLSGGKR